MAYSQAAAVLRQDLNTVAMEAADAEKLFIGEQVFPAYEQDAKSGQYPKFLRGTGQLLRRGGTTRGATGNYNEIIRAYENANFACEDRGLEERVDDAHARDVARFFDAESVATMLTMRNMRIDHEIRVANLLFTAGSTGFTATAALVAYTEALLATIAFHADVLNACDRLNGRGILPNAVVMSGQVFNRVRRSTLAQNFIRGAGKATDATLMLSESDLARSLNTVGIDRILVGKLQYDSANKGLTPVATAIWGNTYIWVGRIEGGDPLKGGAGRTFVWNKEGGLWVTETYRDEKRRSDMVRVRQNTDEALVDASAGELITTSYS